MAGLMESLNKSKTTTGGRGLMGSLVAAQNINNVITNATPQVATPTANAEASQNNGGFVGGLGYLGEKAGLGFLSGIEGIWDYTAGGIAKLFGADDWAEQQFANDWVNYNHADEWYNPSSGWQVAGDVAGGIGTSLPALVGAGIGAGIAYFSGGSLSPLAAKIITASLSSLFAGLGAAGNATKEAYRETGELGGKEFGYGALTGVTEAGVELLSAGMAKGSGRIVSSIAKSTSKEVAEIVAKTGAKSVIRQLGEDFAQEAFEEGLAEFLSPVYQRMTYNPDAKNATVQEIGYAALVGGLSGMVMSGSRVTIGAAVNTTQNYISGNNAVKNGTVESIMREGETLANAETKHQTGYEAFESVKETFEKLRVSLATTGGQVTTVHQKMLLGKLKGATTISRILPYVERSARGLVFSADVAAERYSTFGITDANGKPLKFTAEQLLEGVDTELLAKAKEGSLTDKEARTFALSLRKAIQTNPVLSTLAVAEATGQIILDTRKMAEASLNGQNLANAADLNYLIENGSQEEMDALAEAFGIEDWSKVTIDDFRAKMSEFNASGRISEYAEQSKRVHKAAEQASESAKPLPHLLRRNMTDGVYRYKSNDSAVDMAVIKEGDNYFLYDYEGRHISRALSMQDVNKVLKRFWTSGQTTTAKSMQFTEETNLARETTEIDAYAVENIPDYNSMSEPNKAAIRMTVRQARAHGLSDAETLVFAKVAAKSGLNVIFDAERAFGDGAISGNTIYVNPNNSEARTYEVILGHEMFHKLFADGDKRAMQLFTEARDLLERSNPEKAQEVRERYKKFYKKLGTDSSVAQAISEEEVAARGAEEVFRSADAWAYILSKEPSFADKVLSFFRKSAREYSSVQGLSAQARKFVRQYKALFESLAERNQGNNALSIALEGAGAKKMPLTNTETDSMHVTGDNDEEATAITNADVRYAIKYPSFSEADISSNMDSIADMEAVATIDASKLEKTGKKPFDLFLEYFDALGNNIASSTFGDIALNRASVKSEIRHGITAEKVASLEAIPAVIEQGKVIFSKKKPGTDVDRIVIAAPIKIGEADYYMGVMLQRDTQNQRLYLHNVVAIKAEEATTLSQDDSLTNWSDESDSRPFITSILQKALNVKAEKQRSAKKPAETSSGKRFALPETDSEGVSLSAEQREFFADTKVLDEKGNLLLVYHGTRKADFTKFKRNINYFTDNKDVAESYSPNGEMFEGYVKITNPYIVDAMGEKWSKIPINEKHKSILDAYGGSSFKEEGRWRSTTADFASAIQEMVENGDAEYDGVIIKNVDDTGSYWKIKEQNIGNDYIIFNSNQFKRSDNKKPTTDPDMRFALDIENIDVSWYNEIKLNSSEQNRIQSEALTWDAKHRNEIRSRTLSNDIIYRYVIDDDGIVHVFEREKAKNIHEWREDYGNKGTKRFDRAVEGLRTRQRNDDSNSSTVQNRRESSTDDRRDNTPLRREGRSDGAGYSENRLSSHGRSEAGIQGPYLKVVHTFNDITGRKRNILRVGSNKYMIEGDTRSKYQPTIEAVIKAENERIIDRYTKKKDKSKSFVKAKLAIDPDFLKGFKFALTGNEDLDALLSELYSDTSTVFDVEAILERGIPRKPGVSTLTIGEMKKTIANNTHYQVFSKGKALEVIGRMFGTSDLTAKTRAELADALWQGFNDCTDLESRQTFSHDMAEFIVAKMMTEAKVENPDIIEAQEKLTYLSTYIGKLTFSPQDISELRHIADKDGLRRLLGRWGYKGRMVSIGNGVAVPTKRVPMDVFVCDIAREMPDMADFENMHPAEAFIELDAIYERAKEDVKDKWISAYWEATDADMLAIVSGIEADIMRAFETEGEQSKFSRLVEGRIEYYSTRAEFWKAEHDRIKGRDRILGLLMSQAQKMKDLRLGTFANATQFDSELFKNSIEKLAKIQFRGNLNVSGTRKIMGELLQWYRKDNPLLEFVDDKNPGLYVQSVADMLESLSEGKKGFSKEELLTMYDVMSYFVKFVENYGKVFRNGKMIEALPEAKRYIGIAQANEGLKVGLFAKLSGSWYAEMFSDPATLVRRMDYYERGFYTEMFEDLREAATDAEIAEMRIMREYDEFLRSNKKYIEKASEELIEYRGQKIPKIQLIDLYMTMKRKHAWAGIAINGFPFKNLEGKVVRVPGFLPDEHINETDLEAAITAQQAEIAKHFTDADRQYMAILEKGYNEDARKLKADRDMQRLGFTNASTDYYYPIRRAYTAQNIDTSDAQAEYDRVTNSSFNKDIVKGAKQEIAIESADARFRRHIHAVCQYAYLSPAIETFNRLYNMDTSGNRNHPISVRTASENVWAKGNKYFMKLISDIQGIPTGSSEGMAALSFIRGSYAKFQLGANPKVWLTQLSSIFASSSILDADSITRGVFLSSKGIDEYCPLAELRSYDNTAAMAQGVLDKQGKARGKAGRAMGKVSKFSDLLMQPIGMMDRFVVCRVFGACQVQVEKNGGAKVGTEANKIEAGKLLKKVILETQQNSIATERSAAMRSGNEILRTVTMFTSDSMKVVGRVIDAFGEISVLHSKIKAATDPDVKAELKARLKVAKRNARKATTALVLTAVFMAGIAQLFRWLYDKEQKEDETVAQTMIVDAVGNLFGGLPLIKDVYARIFEGYGFDNYAYSSINDLLDSAINLFDTAGSIIGGEATSQDVARGIKNLSYSIGQMTGLPVRNVYNVFYGLTKRFSPDTAYKIDSTFYAKNYQNDLYKAIENEDVEMASYILSLLYNERMGVDMSEAVHNELYSLSAKGYKVLPKSAPKSITVEGAEYELNEAQQAAVRGSYSASRASLEKLFTKEKYKKLTDEMKAEAVNYVYDLHYNMALEDALGVDRGNAVLISSVIGAENLAMLHVATKGLTSDTDKLGNAISGSKRKKVLAAIKKLNIPTQQKLLLLCAKGYSLKDGDIRGYSAEKAEKYLLNYLLRQSSLTKEQKAELAVLCGFEVKNGKIVQKSSKKQN